MPVSGKTITGERKKTCPDCGLIVPFSESLANVDMIFLKVGVLFQQTLKFVPIAAKNSKDAERCSNMASHF